MSSRAERRREGRGSARSEGGSGRLMWVLGGAGAIAIAIVAWNLFSSVTDETARSTIEVEYDSPQELVAMAQGITSGNPDAPVTVMEFGDYQCPSCQAFFRQAKPILDVSYIQPGRVQFVYYDFPLEGAHPNAFVAARAARCAGDQGAYWPYHDTLYQNQMAWSTQADPVGDLVGYAADLGLDRATFSECLRSDQHAQVVSANLLLGLQLGVQSTPTVMVDAGSGRAIRVANWSTQLRPTLEEALAEAQGGGAVEEDADGGDAQ